MSVTSTIEYLQYSVNTTYNTTLLDLNSLITWWLTVNEWDNFVTL